MKMSEKTAGLPLHALLTLVPDGSKNSASRPSRLNPKQKAVGTTEEEAGWDPQPQTRWQRQEFQPLPGTEF